MSMHTWDSQYKQNRQQMRIKKNINYAGIVLMYYQHLSTNIKNQFRPLWRIDTLGLKGVNTYIAIEWKHQKFEVPENSDSWFGIMQLYFFLCS